MTSIRNIKCTTCGAPLKVNETQTAIKCEYCGSEYIAVQEDNRTALTLNQLTPSLDRAASEMAIKRLKEELAELDAQAKIKLEDLEIKKKQAIYEIEKRKNILISSPAIEKMNNELMIIRQERDLALTRGRMRLGFYSVLNTSMGLVGGCVTFLLSFIFVFFSSGLFAVLLRKTTKIDLTGKQVVPYLFLISTIVAFIFLVVFTKFASRRQNKLSQGISSRQRQLEAAIDEQKRSITVETTKHLNQINEQMANQKLAVDNEVETAKALIKQEISERQEQLEKHYKRVKI